MHTLHRDSRDEWGDSREREEILSRWSTDGPTSARDPPKRDVRTQIKEQIWDLYDKSYVINRTCNVYLRKIFMKTSL